MPKKNVCRPVAGNMVKTTKGVFRVKSVDRFKQEAVIFVPSGVDLDGDVIFEVESVSLDDVLDIL